MEIKAVIKEEELKDIIIQHLKASGFTVIALDFEILNTHTNGANSSMVRCNVFVTPTGPSPVKPNAREFMIGEGDDAIKMTDRR